jgi:hypothetical protein
MFFTRLDPTQVRRLSLAPKNDSGSCLRQFEHRNTMYVYKHEIELLVRELVLVGYFLRDPKIVFFLIQLVRRRHLEDSTAINSSLQCREKEGNNIHDKRDSWAADRRCEQLRVWFVVIDLGKDSWFV